MTVYQPDNTVKNIKEALGAVASSQVANVSRVYTKEPEGPPEDHSIVVGSPTFRMLDDTNAKMQMEFVFPVSYCVIRRQLGEDIDDVESYFLPMLYAYSAWTNQNLTPEAFITGIDRGGAIQANYSGQIVRAIRMLIKVVTEFNIPVS